VEVEQVGAIGQDDDAGSSPYLDDAAHLEGDDGLAHGGPTDLQFVRQLPFRWQAPIGIGAVFLDEPGDPPGDHLIKALALQEPAVAVAFVIHDVPCCWVPTALTGRSADCSACAPSVAKLWCRMQIVPSNTAGGMNCIRTWSYQCNFVNA